MDESPWGFESLRGHKMMNNDYEQLEEDLKKKDEPSANRRKKIKTSGKSVFKLQEIIKKKAKSKEENSEIIS